MGNAGSMTIRRRVLAHGHVQGVFFRDSVHGEAVSRGVAGWVRNRDDGSVEAIFEGSQEAVDALVAFCRAGPGHARVSELEVHEELVEGLWDFNVR